MIWDMMPETAPSWWLSANRKLWPSIIAADLAATGVNRFHVITGRNGGAIETNVAVRPDNLGAVRKTIAATQAQFQSLHCDALLSPKGPWRQPLASWGKFFSENKWAFFRRIEGAQTFLWDVTALGGGFFTLGAWVSHSVVGQNMGGVKESLSRPLEFLANGTVVVLGIAAASHGVEWLLRQPYLRYRQCEELQGLLNELQDVEAAITEGQTPNLEERPALLGMTALPNDIGLGITAVPGAASRQSGTGWVDQVMMGLAAVGVTIATPEITIPRAAAEGWRLAAGAL